MTDKELTEQLTQVIESLKRGRLIFFLGAGANTCDRGLNDTWRMDDPRYLPTGAELSEHLVGRFGVDRGDLARVAQHAALRSSPGLLYLELRDVFSGNHPPTRLHGLLAKIPSILRSRGYPRTTDSTYRRLLLISTNYDDLLERALDAAREPYHSLVYEAEGSNKGKFVHRAPGGEIQWVSRPNKYDGLFGDDHPVVMKFHGSLDRESSSRDSFVITEDHYIDYLTHTQARDLIPHPLPEMLENCGLLFLGYGLRDWNLRVLLHRLWGSRRLEFQSWAIQLGVDSVERELWRLRTIEIVDISLSRYVSQLEDRLRTLPDAGSGRGSP